MEAIIFIGIQASGKSTFYIKHFFYSHLRISLDMLNTRNKENRFLETCLQMRQRLVVDNTNPTKKERKKYIEKAKQHKYKVIGYFFDVSLEKALNNNKLRKGKERIPEEGIAKTFKKLEIPEHSEGFDQLFRVVNHKGDFMVKEYVL